MPKSGPPAPEPQGYAAVPGYVKNNPLNNDYYVEQFKDDPWYPIIKRTHERLTELIPGYNIAQIKDKFGGLRYYFDFPEVIPIHPEWPAYDTEEKVRAMAQRVVTYAEAWVDGFEYHHENNAPKG
jgi:hypothetical protein